MKIILIVADGMADRPVKELGGMTPLEVAHKPALDEVARTGECGIVDIISPGRPPGSDAANLALLGYEPLKHYTGRGALEALGVGIDVRKGDVAFRANFATLDDKGLIIDRRAGRIDGRIMTPYLDDIELPSYPDVKITARPSVEHRAALVVSGEGLSWNVSDSDPHRDSAPPAQVTPLDASVEALRTSHILNEALRVLNQRLEDSPVNKKRMREGLNPANVILVRGAGTVPDLTSLKDLYGVSGTCVAMNAVVRGVCRAAGLDIVEVEGATGGIDTDTLSKARATEVSIHSHDLVYLHVKGTDTASHDGNVAAKIRMIEKIDSMTRHLLDHLDMQDVYIAITADHTTSLARREHMGDPVPLAITGPDVRRDSVTQYDERACALGAVGRIRGIDVMPILMGLSGKSPLYGS